MHTLYKGIAFSQGFRQQRENVITAFGWQDFPQSIPFLLFVIAFSAILNFALGEFLWYSFIMFKQHEEKILLQPNVRSCQECLGGGGEVSCFVNEHGHFDAKELKAIFLFFL